MEIDLLTYLATKNIDEMSKETYSSTLTELYNDINKANFANFLSIAINHYEIFLKHPNLHGFFIVDWRVNFAKLFDYCQHIIENKRSDEIAKFMKYYDIESAPELYKRLDVPY